MRKSFYFFFILFLSDRGIGQYEFPEMGLYSTEELKMTECSFDTGAVAIILLDAAISTHDEDYHLITVHRTRIKILNERGFEYANIHIPYYTKDDFENISDIQAMIYNMNGQTPEIRTVNKNQMYKEVVNDRISRIKFTFPSVKVGSIIEYQYTSEMKHYGGLQEWLFQQELPISKSAYLLTLLPNTEFSYMVTKKPEYEMNIIPYQSKGKVYYEMVNIPALKSEPFMNALNDYIQKVEFKLSSYKNTFGGTEKVNQTWKSLAEDLSEDMYLGNAIKKDLPGTNVIKTLITGETTQTGKLKKIYDYVQTNFIWNGINTKFASDGLKKIMDKRVGSSGELNLLLVNLLNIFDVEAYPLIVAERSFGKVDPGFPLLDRFNKTVVYAIADGKTFILDATEKYCPAQLIPYSLLNTYALIIHKNTKELIQINTNQNAFNCNVQISSHLDKSGILTGKAIIANTDYALQYFLQQTRSDEKKFLKEYLIDQNEGIEINKFTSALLTGSDDTLNLGFDFKKEINDNNNFILFNYNLFTGQYKNPFTRDIRFSDINFGYPYSISIHHMLQVPPETKMDIPENKTISTLQDDISVSRKIERNGTQLDIWININQKRSFYPVQKYALIRTFYTDMLKLLNEPILIKLKQ
jgi:hypothetical protein